MRFCSFLRRLGIACHAVGLLMFLLGFMTVNWVDMPYRRGSAGLWQICYNRNMSALDFGNATGNFTSNHTSIVVSRNRIRVSLPRRLSLVMAASTTTLPTIISPRNGHIQRAHLQSLGNFAKGLSQHGILTTPRNSIKRGMQHRPTLSSKNPREAPTDSPPQLPELPVDEKYALRPRTKVLSAGLHSTTFATTSARLGSEKLLGGEDNSDKLSLPDREDGSGRGEDANGYSGSSALGGKDNEDDDRGGAQRDLTEAVYDDSLPPHIKLDNDGCRKYGVTHVDAYLHMVRALMAITAFCYAYGIFNGSTRRARIQPRSSFTRQHRGELLSYTGAFLSYFAVQIYEFGFHSDTLVTQFVARPQDLRLGWSAQCVRFSSLMVAPSVLLLLAPTLRTKLRKLLSDCWAAIGCTGDEGGANGERRAGLLTTLTHNFWQDPLGNCFRFITCRRIPLEAEASSPDSEMDPVDRPRHSRMSGLTGHGRDSHHPDPRLLHAPPPPYSFLHPIGSDSAVSSYRSSLAASDGHGGDEQYFLVSGILSVAIPHRAVGVAEPAPAYQDISPPPSYEEAVQGIVTGQINAHHSQAPRTAIAANTEAVTFLASPPLTGDASGMEAVTFLSNPPSTELSYNPAAPTNRAPLPPSSSLPDVSDPTASEALPASVSPSHVAAAAESHPPLTLPLSDSRTPTLQTSSSSSLPAPTDLSPTLSMPMLFPHNSSSPSFSSSTSPSPTPISQQLPTSSTSASTVTIPQHHSDARESAAAAVAAAVVSAAATTSGRQNFTLPALRPFPHPQPQATPNRSSPQSQTNTEIKEATAPSRAR